MRTRLVAVIGSGAKATQEMLAQAEELGAALVREGYGIVCGGLGGVMEAVCRGAVRERGKERHPALVGLLPSYDVETANDYLDIVLPTGMGHARNALVAAAGEVVICVGGSAGALSEVGLASKMKRPLIALSGSGGTADVVARALRSVVAAETVAQAVEEVGRALGAPENSEA